MAKMYMASHVAPGNIVCVTHFRVQFSVSCVIPPPPAVRGWLLTRLQKQYDKERERTVGPLILNKQVVILSSGQWVYDSVEHVGLPFMWFRDCS